MIYLYIFRFDTLPDIESLQQFTESYTLTLADINNKAMATYNAPAPLFDQWEQCHSFTLSPKYMVFCPCCMHSFNVLARIGLRILDKLKGISSFYVYFCKGRSIRRVFIQERKQCVKNFRKTRLVFFNRLTNLINSPSWSGIPPYVQLALKCCGIFVSF